MMQTITAARSAGLASEATVGLEGLVNEASVEDEVGVEVADAIGAEEIEEVMNTPTLYEVNAVAVESGT